VNAARIVGWTGWLALSAGLSNVFNWPPELQAFAGLVGLGLIFQAWKMVD
jgi:hypothetical protein